MSWTTPKAWSGSELLTSADMNTYVGSNIGYLYANMPIANQWIDNGTNVAQTNQRIETGYVLVPITTANYGSKAVTFNTAFGSPPRVGVSLITTNVADYQVSSWDAGTGGFTAYLGKSTTGTITTSGSVNWLAIGA